ncbi:MAG TPA: MBOAT family O-acyltransferase [Bryobacteraceae bacterium]|nr:MBOAT family O-acyltransferase [Bryobacteraceae bacterium]
MHVPAAGRATFERFCELRHSFILHMLFNSLEFAIYFPIVTAIYFLVPQVWRVRWLLAASCVFYMAFIPAYILILLATILIDYTAGIYIGKLSGGKRKAVLWVSIVSTCLVLGVFKYFDFLTNSAASLAGWFGWNVPPVVTGWILPIGLSFHTFQSLSYVAEVYFGRQEPERDFIVYATYVMFFPQLVAGPIERPQNLLHQFRECYQLRYRDVTGGLQRMAWGFFKKLVVADRLALYVNDVYAAPSNYNGLQLTIATLFFAYQIYCDFSGYSDIAIGAAQVMGFRLMENFRTPYASLSVSEFWRRWHISLSTWFKDYVYVPLGGSRAGATRHACNLLITFAISGLWHGANWTFVCWGLLNGLYLVAGSFTKEWRDRLFAAIGLGPATLGRKGIMRATTFLLICLAWIIFRAQTLQDAAYVVTHLANGWDFSAIATPHFLLRQMPVAIAAIAALELGQSWQRASSFTNVIRQWPMPVRWTAYAAFVMAVMLFGVYRGTEFIYFQF